MSNCSRSCGGSAPMHLRASAQFDAPPGGARPGSPSFVRASVQMDSKCAIKNYHNLAAECAMQDAQKENNTMQATAAAMFCGNVSYSDATTNTATFTASHHTDYSDIMMNTFWRYQQSGLFTDFVIRVKDKAVHCHRMIISAGSHVYEAMFKSGRCGDLNHDDTFIDMDPYVVGSIVKFMYGQTATFNMDSLGCALEICNILQLKDLICQIAKFSAANMTVNNCVYWWKVSMKFQLECVKEAAIQMMCDEIKDVSQTEDFNQLGIDELLRYINEEAMNCENKDDLLLACMDWCCYDPCVRKPFMLDLVMSINLENISLATLKQINCGYKALIQDTRVLNLVLDEVFNRQRSSEQLAGMMDELGSSAKILIVGGLKDGSMNPSCYFSGLDEPFCWEEFLQIPCDYMGEVSPIVFVYDGFVICCGGNNCTRTMHYVAVHEVWEELPVTPLPLVNASAVCCHNNLYVLGGEGPLDSVYRLDLPNMEWLAESSMKEKQRWPIAAAVNTNIYVVYNDGNGQKQATLQSYDVVEKDFWRCKASLPSDAPRTNGASIMVCDDGFFVAGGFYGINAQYKVSADQWTLLTPPKLQHHYGGGVFLNNKLYLLGGCPKKKAMSVYDICTGEWKSTCANLPSSEMSYFKMAIVSYL